MSGNHDGNPSCDRRVASTADGPSMRGHRSTDETSTVAYGWRSDERPCSLHETARRSIRVHPGCAFSAGHRALHSQPGELLELSRAVAQLLRRHAEEVEHRELQVRQRRVFWIYEMAAALESARAAAD